MDNICPTCGQNPEYAEALKRGLDFRDRKLAEEREKNKGIGGGGIDMDKCKDGKEHELHWDKSNSASYSGKCKKCGKGIGHHTAFNIALEAQERIKALEEESDKRRVAIWLLLDHVDYTDNACTANEMVGATLPVEIIRKAKEALQQEDAQEDKEHE